MKNIISKNKLHKKKFFIQEKNFSNYFYNITAIKNKKKNKNQIIVPSLKQKSKLEETTKLQKIQKNEKKNIENHFKEVGWFVVLDEKGYQGFMKTGEMQLNEKNELVLNGYKILDIRNVPIIVPIAQIPVIDENGMVYLEIKKKNKIKKIYLSQIQYVYLSNADVTHIKNGLYYLNESGAEKYLKNFENINSESTNSLIFNIKNIEKTTENFIKLLKSHQSII